MRKLSVLLILCIFFSILCGCGENTKAETTSDINKVDIDLTSLSSTMVYAEVYSMLSTPENYMGKTVKIHGTYSPSYYEVTDKYYHYILISDATACCSQGIEFLFSTEHTYPADFPADGTEVETVGVFGSYEELNQVYYYLLIDELSIIG